MPDRVTSMLLTAAILTFASNARAETFEAFVQNLRGATHESFADTNSSALLFEEARTHLLRLYDGITVRQSVTDADGRLFDCIRYEEQPAIRFGVVQTIAPPPPFAPDSDGDSEAQDMLPDVPACAAGTFPVERISLDAVMRAGGLRAYLQKSPHEHLPSEAPTTIGSNHKYSYASVSVNNAGGRSDESLYSPPINTKAEEGFSLEQQWYAGMDKSKEEVQTAEVGWQAFPLMYGTRKSVLFAYYTADSYNTTGCYNYTCGAFVQNPRSKVTLGQPFPKYSVRGGEVVSIRIGFTLRPEGWWLSYGKHWVGYYPLSLYGSGQLSRYATILEWGTESVGDTVFPQEGSGAFGGAGKGGPKYAPAFEANIKYRDLSEQWQVPSKLLLENPSPLCYSVGKPGELGSKLGYGFTVGGPGGTGC